MLKRVSLFAASVLAVLAVGQLALPRAAATEKKADSTLVIVTYAVADLVVPIDMEPGEKHAEPATREDQLMRVLRAMVAPESWDKKGGQATMEYYSLGMGLVVQQTPAAHAKIRALLADLRRLQEVEVAVEIRIVSLTPECKEKFERSNPARDQQGHVRMKDKQVKEFVKFFEQDRAICMMQAPKMTVFNGQKAKLSITEEIAYVKRPNSEREGDKVNVQPGVDSVAVGWRFQVRPTVSADRKQVTMNLSVYLANLEGPVPMVPVTTYDANQRPVKNFVQLPRVNKLELDKTLKIADGETVMIHAGRLPCLSRKANPSWQKLPYLDRLFVNVGYGPEYAENYILVTPRLIINQEEEQKIAAGK